MHALTRENLFRRMRFGPLRELVTAGCLLLVSFEASGVRMACTVGVTGASQPARSVSYEYDNLSRVQTLTWDGQGRLVKVVQTVLNPFVWTALYDGLDRRIRTTYAPDCGATVTTTSMFDPEVEFLELGLAIDGAWN